MIMNKTILFYFVIVTHFESSLLYLSENELTIALELSNKLRIVHCIFIDSKKNHTDFNFQVKKFSNAFIHTTLFSIEMVFESIMAPWLYKPFPFKTAFIFKGINTPDIEDLFNVFTNVKGYPFLCYWIFQNDFTIRAGHSKNGKYLIKSVPSHGSHLRRNKKP